MENSATSLGNAGNRGRIATGLRKMEDDQHKSDPKNRKRWTINEEDTMRNSYNNR